MLLDETDGRFCVKDSTLPGVGQGLFAKVPLPEGDRVEILGILIPSDSESDRCTRYADERKFRVGEALLIPVGFGAMVNHSANSNLEKVIEGEKLYLRLTRGVEAGEELFLCYSPYARDRFNLR